MSGLLQNIDLPGADIPWLEGMREKGRTEYERQGLPSAKTEAWKYTRPRDLQADDFVMEHHCLCRENGHGHECGCGEECHCHEAASDILPFPAYELHFHNGILQHSHLHLPRGVTVMPLMEAVWAADEIKSYLGKAVDLESYPLAALNTAYLNEGVFINIARDTVLDKPIALVYHTACGTDNLFYNLRNVISLENGASATIVEYHRYSGAEKSRYFANIVNEIFLGRETSLQHYKLQDEAYKAVHVALSAVKVRGGGKYQSFCLQRGANLARNETKVQLREENAHAQADAAYLMNGWATIDTTTNIEHLAPETYSDQLVKGVVGGDAKGVFQGKIHIAPGAVKTEGKQLHKAVLLTDTAEIDCKPELEIFADDVKCSHGAASGELDEEQLFYMRSRGIGEEEAKQILIDAYLEDVLGRIPDESIRAWLAENARQDCHSE